MRVRFKVVVGTACALVVILIATYFLSAQAPQELSYKGRSLAYWTRQFQANRNSQSTQETLKERQALTAIRVICSNHLPVVVAWLDYDPRPAHRKLRSIHWLPEVLQEWLEAGPLVDRRAVRTAVASEALRILGPEAASAAPLLEKLTTSTNTFISNWALRVLPVMGTNGLARVISMMTDDNDPRQIPAITFFWRSLDEIGTNAGGAMPALALCMESPNPRVVAAAARTLGQLKRESAESIPMLIAALPNSNPATRESVINALGQFGKSARAAVPDLTKYLQDASLDVREAATNAVENIAPGTFTNLPAAGSFRRRYGMAPPK